jgi:hypothetical protein
MLSKVVLNAWKGLKTEYVIGPATLITGDNGSGKSACLDAIAYGLSGSIGGGCDLDHVAKWFGPEGGDVEIWNAAGHFLRRGIRVNAAKGRISEVLETDVLGEDGKMDIAYWHAPKQVLDVRGAVLALSSGKRREFLLATCGGGTVTGGELGAVANAYAREVAGPLGSAVTLASKDLPVEIAPAVDAWCQDRGIREVLAAAVKGSKNETASQLMLRMGDRAKEERLACARAARDAREAIASLASAAKGHEGAAAEVDRCEKAVALLRNEFSATRAHNSRVDEAAHALAAAKAQHERAAAALAEAQATLAALPAATAEPVPATEPAEAQNAVASLVALSGERDVLATEARTFEAMASALPELQKKADKVKADLAKAEASPAARAVALVDGIPNAAHANVAPLREAVYVIAKVGIEAMIAYEGRIRDLDKEIGAKSAYVAENTPAQAQRLKRISELSEQIMDVQDRDRATKARAAKDAADFREAHGAWKAAEARRIEAVERVESGTAVLTQAAEALVGAEKRVADIGAAKDLVPLTAQIAGGEVALATARTAQAHVAALEEAQANSTAQEAMEGFWKIAERAIKSAREELVAAAVAPLLEQIDEVLEVLGRPERAWCALENDRGTPICEMGWAKGGVRANVDSLSAGESVLFLAALTSAIASRSTGICPLLIEADPLDAHNLQLLLDALPRLSSYFACIVVATAQKVSDVQSWTRIDL